MRGNVVRRTQSWMVLAAVVLLVSLMSVWQQSDVFAWFRGENMMRGIVGLYVLTAIAFALEQNWSKTVYWIGACIITSSVLWMK